MFSIAYTSTDDTSELTSLKRQRYITDMRYCGSFDTVADVKFVAYGFYNT